MGEYYIQKPDELYHYGVKGMKWGVRKQRDPTSTKRQGMSTAKKVAIGVGVAVAVAGITYVSVKAYQTSKYNKAARAAVQRAIRVGANTKRTPRMKELGAVGRTERYRREHGHYHHSYKHQRYAGTITGHSGRLTRYGAARYKTTFYKKQMDNALGWTGNRGRYPFYEDKYRTSSESMAKIVNANGGKVPAIRPSTSINKLARKKKFRVIG